MQATTDIEGIRQQIMDNVKLIHDDKDSVRRIVTRRQQNDEAFCVLVYNETLRHIEVQSHWCPTAAAAYQDLLNVTSKLVDGTLWDTDLSHLMDSDGALYEESVLP